MISTYQHDHFVDLCRGPHLEHTGEIPPDAFKLLSVAGAYWRGDEHNQMLQRIYGTVWPNKRSSSTSTWTGWKRPSAGPSPARQGARPVQHQPGGSRRRAGALAPQGRSDPPPDRGVLQGRAPGQRLRPGLLRRTSAAPAWETSGHLGFYKENMYAPMEIEGRSIYLKPMNCPFHIMIYKTRTRSYRDLPLRLAEWGTVYRFERSGVLHGLTARARLHAGRRPPLLPARPDAGGD